MSSRRNGTEHASGERGWGWTVGVAVVYLLLFANLAWLKLDSSRLETFYPIYDVSPTSVAARTTIDALLVFSFKLGVFVATAGWT